MRVERATSTDIGILVEMRLDVCTDFLKARAGHFAPIKSAS